MKIDLRSFGLVAHSSATVPVGRAFGRLTVLAVGKPLGTYRYTAVCQCSCGSAPTAIRIDGLTRGAVIGCGCVQKERTTTHGLTSSHCSLMSVWKNMRLRCTDPSDPAFADYLARGIRVCDRWQDFANFVADMAPTYRKGLTLERMNNDGHYEPDNCCWATRRRQAENRRSSLAITYNNRTQPLSCWAREFGLTYGTLWERVQVWKWEIARALTTPPLDKYERMAAARAAQRA